MVLSVNENVEPIFAVTTSSSLGEDRTEHGIPSLTATKTPPPLDNLCFYRLNIP